MKGDIMAWRRKEKRQSVSEKHQRKKSNKQSA